MAEVPRPGMPQTEKDRLGNALRVAEQRDAAAEVVADDQLDDLTKDQLLQQAELRGVQVKTSANKADIVAALRGEPSTDEEE